MTEARKLFIEASAVRYADVSIDIKPTYSEKACRRCGGSGEFILHSGCPGDCYNCGGKGRKMTNLRAMEDRHDILVLAKLRAAWKIMKRSEEASETKKDRCRAQRAMAVMARQGKSLAAKGSHQ